MIDEAVRIDPPVFFAGGTPRRYIIWVPKRSLLAGDVALSAATDVYGGRRAVQRGTRTPVIPRSDRLGMYVPSSQDKKRVLSDW